MFIYFIILFGFACCAAGVLSLRPKEVNIYSKKQAQILKERAAGIYSRSIIYWTIVFIASLLLIVDFSISSEEHYSKIFEQTYYNFGEGEFNLIMAFLLILPSLLGIIFCAINRSEVDNEITTKLDLFLAEQEEKKQKEINQKNNYNQRLSELIETYGNIEKIIDVEYLNIEKSLIAFAQSKILYIQGEFVSFASIIGCQLLDNQTTITTTRGNTQSVAKNNTASTLGRAVVGGVIAGGVGAIIGGTTAKKEITSTHKKTSTTTQKHDYTIVIEVMNISNPIIKLDCQSNEEISYEIIGLINAIIALNER